MHDAQEIPLARDCGDVGLPQRLTLRLSDGYDTSVWLYRPPADVQLALPVLYAHGIQSHVGWFSGSCAALARAGHPVYLVTRRGSGDNPAARGHARSACQLLDDVHAACQFAAAHFEREFTGWHGGRRMPPCGQQAASDSTADQSPSIALHLVGVSWGGKLLAAYCAGRAVDIASLTLIAPGLSSRVDVPACTKLAIAVSALVSPTRAFVIPLSDVELFTDNPQMQQYLRDDPWRLHRASARFLLASAQLDRRIKCARRGSLTAPTTLLLASRDRIIDNDRTRQMVEHLTAGQAKVHELDAAHTMDFESEPSEFYRVLVESLR